GTARYRRQPAAARPWEASDRSADRRVLRSIDAAADPTVVPRARLTVLSGPTAVGKGTVVTRLNQEHPEIFVSVSVTTRPPRPGEVDGVHYHFVSDAEFDALIADGALLEWAIVPGGYRHR